MRRNTQAQENPAIPDFDSGTPLISPNIARSPRIHLSSLKVTLDPNEYSSVFSVYTAVPFPRNEIFDLVKIDPLSRVLGGSLYTLSNETFQSENGLLFQGINSSGVNDLDGNGFKDLWVLYTSRWFEVYLNHGNGTLSTRPDFAIRFGELPPPATPMSAIRLASTATSLTEHQVRGRPADVVYTTLVGRGSIFNPWLENQGIFKLYLDTNSSGNLELRAEDIRSAFTGWENNLVHMDLDGDTRPDLLGADIGKLRVLWGQNRISFQSGFSEFEPLTENGPISAITPIDFDPNTPGKEFFMSYIESGAVMIVNFNGRNIQTREFDLQNRIDVPGAQLRATNGIISGDLNQDGNDDLVFALRYYDPARNDEFSAYALFISSGEGDLEFVKLIPCGLEIRMMPSRVMSIDDFTNDGINDFLAEVLISGEIIPVVYKNLASTEFAIEKSGQSGTASNGGSPQLDAIGIPRIGNRENFKFVARSSRPRADITIFISTDPLDRFIPPEFHLYVVPLNAPHILQIETQTDESGVAQIQVPLDDRIFNVVAQGQYRLYFQIFEWDPPVGRMVSGNRLTIQFAPHE